MRIKWWNSLRTKIIAWSFVPTVIILSAVAWFTFYSYQKVIVDQALKQDHEMAVSNTNQIMQVIVDTVNSTLIPVLLMDIENQEYTLELRAEKILEKVQSTPVIYDGGIY